MATHITQIGRHRFVCGLFWQSLSRPRELRREATELARKIDVDLMVLRKDHSMAQAGYASTADGARRGMFSLAAIVSKTVSQEGAHYDGRKQPVHNWLSAFKLPDGMWAYFAVRDANFLPNGDFAGTKEEVLERLHGDYGLGGWNVVIGDPELEDQGFHNFSAKRIEDLIPHKKNGQIQVFDWWALMPVERRLAWKPVVAGVALAVIAAGAAYSWWKVDQAKKAALARAQAIAAARARLQGRQAPSILPHPWPDKPLPLALAQACVDNLKLLAPGGWKLDDYVCEGRNASYLWSRNGSTVDYLLQQVPEANVEISGEKASLTQPLALSVGSDEALRDPREVLRPMLSRLQLLGVKTRITNVPGAPQPLPGNPRKRAVADWQTFTLNLGAGGVPPVEIAAVLDQPGMRIDKLSYHDGAWSIEGVLYAK